VVLKKSLLSIVFLSSFIVSAILLWDRGFSKASEINDYISDEVWYVSSAVNLARSILGVRLVPWINSSHAIYTVFYDNASCSLAEAYRLVKAAAPSAALNRTGYSRISAFVITVEAGDVGGLEDVSGSACIKDLMPGVAPDNDNINTYLNTEHPPLVKYIIALVIYIVGWKPAAWRLPSYIMGLASIAAVGAVSYRVAVEARVRRITLTLLALLPIVYVLRDPSIAAMSSVAMLDIYAAGFDMLALLAALQGRYVLAGLLLGLAASSKYTGLFPLPALLAAAMLGDRGGGRGALKLVIVAFATMTLSWAPFIAAKGPAWVAEQVLGAVKWHTSSRPPGPPTVTPWGMLLGRSGFVLYYTSSGEPLLTAVCNPGVCLAGVAVGFLEALAAAIALCERRAYLSLLPVGLAPLSVWLGFLSVYAAGNHTLYNFYSVQLSLLSLQALASIPVLVDNLSTLRPRRMIPCVLSVEARPFTASIAALLGVIVGVAAAHGTPLLPLTSDPLASPLYTTLGSSKLERLSLAAISLLLYPLSAYRLTGETIIDAIKWLAAGLASFTTKASPLTPILVFAFMSRKTGFVEGFLASIASPTPLALSLAIKSPGKSRRSLSLGFMAGTLTVALLFTWLKPIGLEGCQNPICYAGIAFLTLSLAWGSPEAVIVSLALIDPSFTPLLAFIEVGGRPLGMIMTPLAVFLEIIPITPPQTVTAALLLIVLAAEAQRAEARRG